MYKNKSDSLSMAGAMKILPDAIFCHTFWAVREDKEIKQFEVMGIQRCMEAMPNCDNQNDCCIGNDH